MPREHRYWVYILASWSRVLYIGVTSDIEGRLYEPAPWIPARSRPGTVSTDLST